MYYMGFRAKASVSLVISWTYFIKPSKERMCSLLKFSYVLVAKPKG
jgi:hypothetical protein